jgi:hypothetical protein
VHVNELEISAEILCTAMQIMQPLAINRPLGETHPIVMHLDTQKVMPMMDGFDPNRTGPRMFNGVVYRFLDDAENVQDFTRG